MSIKSLIIGLTGNIATGKSAVAQYLADKGAYVMDADKLAHKVMEPGGPAYAAIVDKFGKQVLKDDGAIDRMALGKIVFSSAEKLGRLEQIVHPAVFEMIYRCVESCSAGIAILEAIKLLEAGPMATLCDEIWVVTSDPEAQLHRSMEKRGMTAEEARQRMQMQSPQAAKVNQADRVIENNGTLQDLYARLDEIWQDLQSIYPGRVPNPAP